MTGEQIIQAIIALVVGGGITQLLVIPMTRRQIRKQLGDQQSEQIQAYATTGLASLQSALTQAENEARNSRTESREARAEAAAARNEAHEVRMQLSQLRHEALLTTHELRRLREAIMRPDITVEKLRSMVNGSASSGSQGG